MSKVEDMNADELFAELAVAYENEQHYFEIKSPLRAKATERFKSAFSALIDLGYDRNDLIDYVEGR